MNKKSDNPDEQQIVPIVLALVNADLICSALIIPILSSSEKFKEIMYSIQEGLSQYDNLSNSAIRGMAEDAKKGAKTILNKFETQTEQRSIEKAKVQFQKFSLADQEILQETAERFLQNVKSIVIEGPQKQHAQLCTLFLNKAVMRVAQTLMGKIERTYKRN